MSLLLALACSTSSHIELGAGDSGRDTDAAVGDDTGDELPANPEFDLGEPSMNPDGGGFVGTTTVTLTVEKGEGQLQYCTADPGSRTCTMRDYTGPVELSSSTILRAQVVHEDLASEVEARSFVELDDDLEDFRSTLPVLVFWGSGDVPDSSTDVALGLDLFEPAEGAEVSLLDPPTNSGRSRMHVRGSSSAGFEKHAYDLELWEAGADADRRASLAGMPANADWVLYAPYYFDEALIRNPLAYALSNTLGRYAPRTRMVEVFVAGRHRAVGTVDYQGVYVLTEEVQVDPERVAITPMTPADVAEPEVTGGFLFKVDRLAEGESGFYAGTAGGLWQFQQGFVYVDPNEDEIVRAQATWLSATVDSIGDALAADDLTDPRTGLRYDELLDVDSFIDHHIVNVYLKNPDAFRLSGYLHKDREGLVHAGPVWDFDRAAGSADSRSFLPTWWDDQNETTDCTAVFDFGWYAGLFEDPEFADRYWTRFATLLDTDLSPDAVDAQIDTLTAGLDDPADRNSARWGSADYRTKVTELKGWFHRRHAWMEACIAAYPDPRDCPG